MNKSEIKWLVLSMLALALTLGIYMFVRENTVPMYSCTACLQGQCASSTITYKSDYKAAREARSNLCYQIHKDSIGSCFDRPEKDFTYQCPYKREFYLDWFAGWAR